MKGKRNQTINPVEVQTAVTQNWRIGTYVIFFFNSGGILVNVK